MDNSHAVNWSRMLEEALVHAIINGDLETFNDAFDMFVDDRVHDINKPTYYGHTLLTLAGSFVFLFAESLSVREV